MDALNIFLYSEEIIAHMDNLAYIKSKIRTIPDFPKKGIMFRDITTLLKDAKGFHLVIEELVQRYRNKPITSIAGIESRGFIIGAALAEQLHLGFIPIRKKGKLPGPVEQMTYDLEYGTDTIEMHKDALQPGDNILLVDDLIATGGTAAAACHLIEKLGGKVDEVAFVIALPELHGEQKLKGYPMYTMVSFEGH